MHRAGEYPQSDQEYFGLLARAVFSAGLGPKVVESRWKEMGNAFHGFDPGRVGAMDEADVSRLLGDPGVIRNRRKIEAVIENGKRFVEKLKDHPSFHSRRTGCAGGPGRDCGRAGSDVRPPGQDVGPVLPLQRRLAAATDG
ncbi:MAG: DNA-3-methyladenine glycosylase I [Thermoleophilia bacterium]|nr:DNA-3-methyladenine glycosylase I [Thermoleophilia bacterium]